MSSPFLNGCSQEKNKTLKENSLRLQKEVEEWKEKTSEGIPYYEEKSSLD